MKIKLLFFTLILSVALLLRHLGHDDAAAAVDAAVASDLASRDGARPTTEVGDAVVAALRVVAAPKEG